MGNDKTQIYYVHGFASGANSGTFLKLREAFPWTKALEYDSALRFEDNLESLLGQLGGNDDMRLFVGSSLGGLYTLALVMSDKAKSKSILVNPCVQPTDNLKKYIGIQKNFSTGKDFDFSSEDFEANRISNKYEIVDELHLYVSLRSYRSEKVSDFVKALIDNGKEDAKKLYKEISEVYPIYMTRDLGIAKAWVKNKAKDNSCRYGIIASSKAKRLRSEGIWVECKCTPKKWFLNDTSDIKSSYCMEEVATEFDIQGLEIDWAIVAWDADYRYEDGEFKYYKPRGSIWNTINKDEGKRYLKNAYRVLLTRAREGFILFVPKGDDSDKTRFCKYYDELWNYLTEVGIRECSTSNIESI